MGVWAESSTRWATALAGVSALASATAATAQSAPAAPSRDELERFRTPPQTKAPSLNVVGDVERSPCPLADPRYQDVRLTISGVEFNGLKGASVEEMRPTWARYAGTEQPVAVLCDIRDAAATLLRDKGYLAAVQVPTQQIEGGQVRMEVLYARVTAIRARGETDGAEAKLAGYLNKLTEDEIFDRNRAERYLLLARDLPGYNVQLTLRPAGTGPGELVGEVTVLRRPYALDLSLQNLASKQTGRWGGQVRGQLFGVTGLGDVTSLSLYTTADFDEQQILQVGHSFRPGSEGLTIDGQFTYAWTKPDIGASGTTPDLKARTLFATVGASYPLRRRQTGSVTLAGGLDIINQKVDFFGPLTRDRLRVLWLRGEFDAIDLRSRRPAWKLGGSIELRRGIGIFDATKGCSSTGCTVGTIPPSRADGDPTATVLRATGSAELALGSRFALAVSPRAQIGFDPLLSFEEFTAGTYTVGRGYDPATISGDSGAGVSTELRGPRVTLSSRSGLQLQPYVFADAAWVWNHNLPGDPEHLKSTGGGVRMALGDRMRLDAALAVPLEKAGPFHRRGDARFLLSLTTRLLPWS